MGKLFVGFVGALLVVACGSGTGTTSYLGAGPGQSQSPTLPSECSEQPGKLSREYCEPIETLVACPAQVSPPSCKRSVLGGSFCCPTPPPSSDPRLQQICAGLVRCTDFPNFECQERLETARGTCAAELEALLRCGSTGDACSSGERCGDAFAAYYACKGAAYDCAASAEAETACARVPSGHAYPIALACASLPEPTGACSAVTSGNKHFLCCQQAFLPTSSAPEPPKDCRRSSVCINGACKCGDGPNEDAPCQKSEPSAADYCDTLCEVCL